MTHRDTRPVQVTSPSQATQNAPRGIPFAGPMMALLLVLLLAFPAQTAQAQAPATVADIPPVGSLVAMVTGDTDSVDVLVQPGASAHGLSLKPSQARTLGQTALVVWIGPALSPELHRQIAALAPNARQIVLSDVPGTLQLPFREGGLIGEHGHDDHGHDDHDHTTDPTYDPHLWLSPDNATLWLGAIAQALARIDPDNADTYARNAALGADRIAETTAQVRATLSPVLNRPLGVSHDAFQYFEKAFGLTVIGALSDGDDSAPGAARIAAVNDHFANNPPICILTEPGSDAGLVSTVAPATIPRAELDVLGSALPQNGDLYPALLVDIAARIAACAAN